VGVRSGEWEDVYVLLWWWCAYVCACVWESGRKKESCGYIYDRWSSPRFCMFFRYAISNHPEVKDRVHAFSTFFYEKFSEESFDRNIMAGWKQAGLFPWDPERLNTLPSMQFDLDLFAEEDALMSG